MTLTPQQRAEVVEAMARAICEPTISPDDRMPDGVPYWRLYVEEAQATLDAALPLIERAVLGGFRRPDTLSLINGSVSMDYDDRDDAISTLDWLFALAGEERG